MKRTCALLLALLHGLAARSRRRHQPRSRAAIDPAAAARFAQLALACVHLEYPNKIAHLLRSDADLQVHRMSSRLRSTAATTGTLRCTATGCWSDWRRLFPDTTSRPRRAAALAASLTAPHIAGGGRLPARRGAPRSSVRTASRGCSRWPPELGTWDDPQAQPMVGCTRSRSRSSLRNAS